MFFVAWRNFTKERTRLALTLVGVTFAVVLMLFDVGAYLGFVRASSLLIDRSTADIWVTLQNNRNFDSSRPFPERKLWKVKQIPGVEWAFPVAKGWGLMKLTSGSTEMIMVVGFDPSAPLGLPWSLKEGRLSDLKIDDTILVDQSALRKLENLGVSDEVEIFETRVRVVGITQEVRSFTTYPTVFANYETAKRLTGVYRSTGADQTSFILVKAQAGASIPDLVERLKAIGGVDVYAKNDFSTKTRRYWIVQTGMGVGFGITALLGFLVGVVIVGQTIYTSTLEHLREFGTLKALGASNRDIVAVIVYQAIISAILGYLIGLGLSTWAAYGYERLGLRLISSPWINGGMLIVTLGMCLSASIISMRRALRIDPAMVFRA
jgi:putative ABC transport system permease protein